MPIGRLSIRVQPENRLHHIWCNNGTWWIAYVLHFAGRKRRIRRSLGTSCVAEAIRRRDAALARIERHGEEVPERRRRRGEPKEATSGPPRFFATTAGDSSRPPGRASVSIAVPGVAGRLLVECRS